MICFSANFVCLTANVVSPFQGFVGVVDVSTVCNTPEVLYYWISKPRSGDTTIE